MLDLICDITRWYHVDTGPPSHSSIKCYLNITKYFLKHLDYFPATHHVDRSEFTWMLESMIIYRMVIVEGRCTKLLISYIYNHWLTQKYSEFWLVRYNGLVKYCCYFLLPSYIYDHCLQHIEVCLSALSTAVSIGVMGSQPSLYRDNSRSVTRRISSYLSILSILKK